ncbi:CoA transferase [Burkholderia dolosa]|uniref:CaiB/BaiF CoA transferase family protein n=1 Tax=Burkholderia dolosa TaxID=152500 RepID=UPI00158FE042
MSQTHSNMRPLSGVTVLDLTHVLSGPFCTMILADLGARVIKIERPDSGDEAREFGPFVDVEDGTASGYFFSVNRGKESIVLDLKVARDRFIFQRMLEQTDILVENFKPGVMDRLGLGWKALSEAHPRLVMCSVSGFGQTGPYRALPAYDLVVQAMGGIMSLTGPEGGPAVRVGTSIGDLCAGLYAAIGILAALHEREHTGRGSYVDVAMLDVQVAMLENAIVRYQVDGRAPEPIGARHPSVSPFGAFHAKDGPLMIAVGSDAMFEQFCLSLGWPEGRSDSRFHTNASRNAHLDELTAEIEVRLRQATVDEWLVKLQAEGIPCSPLNDVGQVLRDPQLRARDMFVDLPIAKDVNLTVAGSPLRFADHAPPAYHRAPRLGEHSDALIAEFCPEYAEMRGAA